MASIQARKGIDERGKQSTNYRVQVRLHGFPPVTATFERRTDAKEWGKATEASMREGRYFPQREAKRRTLGDLVDRQLETVRTKRPHDYDRQRGLLGWWRENLGDYALASVTPALIAEKRDKLLSENIGTPEQPQHRAPATVNRHLAALSKAFTNASREWNWIQDNPLRRVTKETEPPGRVRYLSERERAALMAACQKSELPELYLIVLLALTTAMRRGELLGLRWPDVDLERRLIVLNKTKNRERRSVPIVPDVTALLREHAKVRRLDSDLLFAGNEGRSVDIDSAWYAALSAAKIKDFRFHDLRHTAASYLAMSGASVPELAAVLGHKTLAMVKRYAHLSDQHTGTVIERMTRKYFA
jgi:integrase